MKSLSIASLALVASLFLTGCAPDRYNAWCKQRNLDCANKFYDLGYEIGKSREFEIEMDTDARYLESNPDETYEFIVLNCKGIFDDYRRQDSSFALPTDEDIETLYQGCSDGWRAAVKNP